MLPSRASTVARVVPPLAQVLARAFTASAIASGVGKRTQPKLPKKQPPPHFDARSKPERGPPLAKEGESSRSANRPRTTAQRLALPTTAAQPIGMAGNKEHRSEDNVFKAQPRPFSAFEMHPGLQAGLEDKYHEGLTTPIQSLSLMNIMGSGPHRAVLAAETGSGKTLAYMLPLLHHLKETDQAVPRGTGGDEGNVLPRALVLSPTHELTRQSTAVAKSLTHRCKLSVLGGSSPGSVHGAGAVDALFTTSRSAAWLLNIPREVREGTREGDLAVKASKKRSAEEDAGYERKRKEILDCSRLEWLVIDEADVLLGPDFLDETAKVLERIQQAKPDINILLVTATLPPSLHRALESNPLLSSVKFDHILSPGLHRLPKRLETRFVPWSGQGNNLADIAHEMKRVFAEDAAESKAEGEKTRTKAVVFCGSVPKVKSVAAMLESKEIRCLPWTGESEQRVPGRNGPLDTFLASHKPTADEAKGPRVLVTTSLLSRGLDFSPAVSTIYLLDPPRNVLDFVHRAGRAGRAGRPGRVVVFGVRHAGEIKYGEELRSVLGKTETRAAVKAGGRTWSGKKQFGVRR